MPKVQFNIPGSTAIVTGGSSGIGRRITEQFTANGIDVAICSREIGNLRPVAQAIEESDSPGEVLPVECDVRDRSAVDEFVTQCVEKFGGVDILVNNAGATFNCGFDDLSENGWKTIVDINLHGVYNCTHACKNVLKDGEGTVVNISSIRGHEAAPRETHYAAAKAGVNSFTRSLASEWANNGVRVNCIAPGFVATPGAISSGDIDLESINRKDVNRQIGNTSEIADVVEFLVSDGASFITGEILTVRGIPNYSERPQS